MILILTQCFPSRIGGVENLISNLSLSLSNAEKIIVFADSHHLTNDAQYDNLYKNKITVYRTGGIKFLSDLLLKGQLCCFFLFQM